MLTGLPFSFTLTGITLPLPIRTLPPVPGFFAVCGPTATGKTALAIALAEKMGGEIVNADAFQVYAGLDLLTAKPSAEGLARVPHHLIGVIPLQTDFNVARYLELARIAIHEIRRRGKPVIVCGGTGLYLRALTRGLAQLPPTDPALRADLEQRPLDSLVTELQQTDPAAAAQVDLKNKRRVLRALEILRTTGQSMTTLREGEPCTDVAGVFLLWERDELHQRIAVRTREMFSRGVVAEVATLPAEPGATASQVLGLREIRQLIAGEISELECIDRITIATRQYAKRQLTWFRRETIFQPILLTATSQLDSLTTALAAQAALVSPPLND